MTVAFSVKLPLPWKKSNTLYKDKRREWQFIDLATIWHVDPEKDGSDDSCGWFMRAHHGDEKVLTEIIKAFEWDWDRVFKSDSGKTYHCGYFHPEDDGAGMPNMSVSAIVLNLFFIAAGLHFESTGCTNWRKARRWMQRNLFDILLFAENLHDSMRDGIIRKWGCDTKREDRIRQTASCIYGWILRQQRPWYRHPRYHIWHWKIQVPLFQKLHRWLFVRCCKCKKGFRWNESVIGSWSGKEIWHDGCDSSKTL